MADGIKGIRAWFDDMWRIFFPPVCWVCGRPLVEGEEVMCLTCDAGMPRTHYHLDYDNPLRYKLIGHVPLVHAAAMFHYARNNPYSRFITKAKYNSHPEIARKLARLYASELLPAGFFAGVDLLVPVPMHWLKKVRRGYNQAEEIAKGIGEITGIAVCEALRGARHGTQTRKSSYERLVNVRDTYRVENPEDLEGKHVMLVDDVVTTGATLLTCCEAIHRQVPSARLSVIALASTHSN